MDHLTSSTSSGAVWFTAVALLLTMIVLTALRKRKNSKASPAAAPPVLHGAALVRFARGMVRDGPLEAIREQQAKPVVNAGHNTREVD
ncbi:hypothetical protein E2562_013566 [Oryza meyeriana var. granulata]|uniref:Uncharacterized protein n=1 Tax=Oryza meyeriana var. granulata TaxID=110450 RepID=A0A6G1D3L7_9ORYZ|nr:hypothetical protein E2562_013566 [Oryza meyeriana var. granulata]